MNYMISDLNALLEPTNLMRMKNAVLGQSAPSLTAMVCVLII